MTGAPSRLNIERTDGRILVSGEVDAHTCPDLTAVLDPLPGDGDVYVGVAEVSFMDSSGLRALISAHQAAESNGRRLLIGDASKPVARLIEISGLAEHLHLVSSS